MTWLWPRFLSLATAGCVIVAFQVLSILPSAGTDACGSPAGEVAGLAGAGAEGTGCGSGVGTISGSPELGALAAGASVRAPAGGAPASACCAIGPRLMTLGWVKP